MAADLSSVKILDGLGPAERDRVGALCELRRFPRGETIFAEGSPGDAIYFLLSGRVDITMRLKDDAERLATHKPGDSFGEFAALDSSRRSASAVAATDVEVAVVRADAFYALLGQEKDIGYVVMRSLCLVMCERLKNSNLQWRNAIYWG